MRLELRPGVTVEVSRIQLAELVGGLVLFLVEVLLLWQAVAAYRQDAWSTGIKYSLGAVVISIPTCILMWRWQRTIKGASRASGESS